jgi:hypothetical protein
MLSKHSTTKIASRRDKERTTIPSQAMLSPSMHRELGKSRDSKTELLPEVPKV